MTFAHSSETHFSPRFAELLAEERCASLGPGEPNNAARAALAALKIDDAFLPDAVVDPGMAQAALAGIWLYDDFLDESHRISQNIQTTTGSFWHGIVHRREPDSWNSKYWFERVGSHPI
ncbi:MAG: hypothetical protein H6R26_3090, partial [Proteobacteria bacterium]|nr:hypothetical protein [Pseudomonadota bacterium]